MLAAEFETITINYSNMSMTGKRLTEIANKYGVPPMGTKRKLFDKLCNSEHIIGINSNLFMYRWEVALGETVPMWIILNPEQRPEVEGNVAIMGRKIWGDADGNISSIISQ